MVGGGSIFEYQMPRLILLSDFAIALSSLLRDLDKFWERFILGLVVGIEITIVSLDQSM